MHGTTRTFGATFTPLRNRNTALYLGGQAISLVGTWMQATAQSWVVWQLTHSTGDLGLVAMLGALPLLLLGPFAGVWADRLDRRKLLVWTQAASMLLAFLFATLVQTQLIQLWHVFLLALALGCVSALDMPAQTAFIGDLAGMEQVRQAVVLNAMVMQVSRMVGPTLAGWVIGALGVAPTFWLNGASFLAVIGSLMAVRAQQVRKPAEARHWNELLEGFRFIAAQPRIQDLLLFTASIAFFVFTSVQLLPAIVTDQLRRGPESLGLIMGASGLGALTGSLVVVPLAQRAQRVGWLLAGAMIWIGVWFVAISFSTTAWLWAAGMFLAGLTSPVIMAMGNGLLQVLTPPEMRARVLSAAITISFGTLPIASLLVGYSGELLGAPGAIRLNGAALVLVAAALLGLRSGLRHWRPALPGSDTRPRAAGAPARELSLLDDRRPTMDD